MAYAIIGFFAFLVGGALVFVLTERKRLENKNRSEELAAEAMQLRQFKGELDSQRAMLNQQATELNGRAIAYSELQSENNSLKSIQRTLAQHVRKHDLDLQHQQQATAELTRRTEELGRRYLSENVKWIGKGINANNYAASKQKLLDVIRRCRDIGFAVSSDEEMMLLSDLKTEFESAVRIALEKEEQARIKAQIREEQLREKEIQRELDRVAREKEAIEAALQIALAQAKDEHDVEVQRLRERLAEAEASQRAISQAQLTKSGHVYVISNIGSFGEGVYKIGMTRRLAPVDRVRELGSASVPFPFDVHMMISADNAPELEHKLHKKFQKKQINRVNPRKEFFRADLQEIVEAVREYKGEVEYEADPEALEYRQSLTMSDDDQDYIEKVYDDLAEAQDKIGSLDALNTN